MTAESTKRRPRGTLGQMALGAVLLIAGIGHLTKQRQEFRAQVPTWFPADPDTVVVVSGIVELALGAALVATRKQPRRAYVGGTAAVFFVAVFPGNIARVHGAFRRVRPRHRRQARHQAALPAGPRRVGTGLDRRRAGAPREARPSRVVQGHDTREVPLVDAGGGLVAASAG